MDLILGMSGASVTGLQVALSHYAGGKCVPDGFLIDGIFGPQTASAVSCANQDLGLSPSSIATDALQTALGLTPATPATATGSGTAGRSGGAVPILNPFGPSSSSSSSSSTSKYLLIGGGLLGVDALLWLVLRRKKR